MCSSVMLAFVALIYGQFPATYGSKAVHAAAPKHPLLHPAAAVHPALHTAAAVHLALHPKVAHHLALHPKAVPHPALHPKLLKHPAFSKVVKHLALHPKVVKHPALHPEEVRHTALHPKILHPKEGHLRIPFRIPDILDKASEAFAHGDSLLKKYARDGSVTEAELKSALQKTIAIKETLGHNNLEYAVYGLYQRLLELMLKQLIEDIKEVLTPPSPRPSKGAMPAKIPSKVSLKRHSCSPYVTAHLKPHQSNHAQFIPVIWKAIAPHKLIKHSAVSHPHLATHPNLVKHPKEDSHPVLVSHVKLVTHPSKINQPPKANH